MTAGRRGLGVVVVVGAWAFLFGFHRPPTVLLFDYAWIVYNLLPLPLSFAGMLDAIRWQAIVHTPSLTRPARAVVWWLATPALGCSPLGYYVVNGLTLGAAVWAIWRVAEMLTGSPYRALVVALGVGVSYATVFPLLFFGYGQAALLAYLGLAAWFQAEGDRATRRGPLRLAAAILVVLAALMHETYLAYALVPLLHALVVRRSRPAALRAAGCLTILAVYGILRVILNRATGSSSTWLHEIVGSARESPGVLVENPGRVLFAVLTGGLPLDPLRALPWFPEFARMREMMLSSAGIATLVVVVVPTLGLARLALAVARDDVAARRRTVFYLLWLAVGSLPLMLPVGTPEAMHLIGALPALFLLWSEAFASSAAWRVTAVAGLLLAMWTGVHMGARWILFHRDVPAMSSAVGSLHRVLRDAEHAGARAAVVFFPVQIGGHYGMLPSVPALYSNGTGGCQRGARPAGCLVEPVWVWSTLRPPPRLPPACRTTEGLRVGPIAAAAARELEGSRRMLGHSTVTLTKPMSPALMGLCPLGAADEEWIGGARYRVYRLDAAPDARWYRFTLDDGRELVPVADCGR